MNQMDLMSPSKVAEKYGGNKQKIAQAVQIGLIDPTVAVMAGMFIDRMRGATGQANKSTVAEDVMSERGLASLPVDESMVPGGEGYAGGGIVSFDGGGGVYSNYTGMPNPRANLLQFTPEEEEEQKRLKEAGLLEALGYMKRKFADPVVQYFTQSPLSAGGPRAREVPAAATAPEVAGAPYADEGSRGTARRVAQGGPGRSAAEWGIGAANIAAQGGEEAPPKADVSKATAAAAEDQLAKRKRMLKEAGLPDDLMAADRASLAEMKNKLAQDREEAKAMALMQAGFGMMGGKSPYALQNIGEGAKQGVSAYEKSMREIKGDEKEYAKIERDLNKAEQAYKVGNVDKALEYEDKAESRRIQLVSAQAQQAAAAKPSATTELLAALKSEDPKTRAAAEKFLGQAKMGTMTYEEAAKLVLDKMPHLGMKGKEQELQAAIASLLQGQNAPRFQGFSARPLGQ